MAQGGLSHSQFLPRLHRVQANAGSHCEGLVFFTGHSILLTDLPRCGALESSRSSFDCAQFVWRVGSLRSRTLIHTLVLFFHITTLRDILWHATKCEALVDMAVNVSPGAQCAFVDTLCSTQELKHVTLWRCALSRFPFFLSCPRVGIATRCVCNVVRHKDLE